jgi:hypothetical protein
LGRHWLGAAAVVQMVAIELSTGFTDSTNIGGIVDALVNNLNSLFAKGLR